MLACPLLESGVEHSDNNILKAMKKLRYPVLATLKMDGIRALRCDILRSRTMKMIPNLSLCHRALDLPVGFDMELWSPKLDYNAIQSIVMSREHPLSDRIEFHVFDDWRVNAPYTERLKGILDSSSNLFHFQKPFMAYDYYELFILFKIWESNEGEGICFRTPDSPYKNGRSTLREQYLVKLCRYIFSEVEVIGFTEQFENTNTEKHNDVDKMDRSKALDGLKPKKTLGAFVVKNEHNLVFSVGTGVGLTDDVRKEIWLTQDKWLGKVIKIRSKAHGVKIKPRSPTYWGRI